MTSTDPAERAAQQASELVTDKIDRVRDLARAVAAEDPLSELVTAAKKAGDAATGQAAEQAHEARRAAEAALKSARAETQARRKAATDVGWSIPELARMNLAKARAPRKAKSKSSPTADEPTSPSGHASPLPAEEAPSPTGSGAPELS
jgi:hypothetical protein